MAIVFNNPFYDFQLKERQEIEMFQLSHLALLKNKTMGKISMSPSETKKFEKRQADETARINQLYKDLAANEAKKNIRIDLLDAYQYYNNFINIRPENLIESRYALLTAGKKSRNRRSPSPTPSSTSATATTSTTWPGSKSANSPSQTCPPTRSETSSETTSSSSTSSTKSLSPDSTTQTNQINNHPQKKNQKNQTLK